MQYLGAISKMTEQFLSISKANQSMSQVSCNMSVSQVNAPTSNAEEAEVECFYEDLQDILELIKKINK